MGLVMVVMGSLVLGQAATAPLVPELNSPATETLIPESEATRGREGLPGELSEPRLTPLEMVAEAIEIPQGGNLAGHPVHLLTAMTSTLDRRQQLSVVVAYWRLVKAVASYHFVLDYETRLSQLEGEAVSMRGARASAAVSLRETELSVVVAQHELATVMQMGPDAILPLPADPPHVGPYHTRFDELFAMQSPPGRIRVIDRTLPIRRAVIESRVAAVLAAEAEEAAAVATFRQGRGNVQAVLSTMRRSLAQQDAFMASVCQYNHDIAEYVFAVVGPETSGPALLRMMITPTEQPSPAVVVRPDGAVRPAGYHEAVPTPARRPRKNVPTPARRPSENVPTPAVRPQSNVPTPAKRPPRATTAPDGEWSASEPPAGKLLPLIPLPISSD